MKRDELNEVINELFGFSKKQKSPKGDVEVLYRFIKDKVNSWAMMSQDKTNDKMARAEFLEKLIDAVKDEFKPVMVPQFSTDEIESAIVKAFKVAKL